jgi:NADP-dependent 3-hydroxy acid dehydrogenase YdfG
VATELPTHISDEEAQQGMNRFANIEILEAEDIAHAIAYAATQPERVSVNEVLIRPTRQEN